MLIKLIILQFACLVICQGCPQNTHTMLAAPLLNEEKHERTKLELQLFPASKGWFNSGSYTPVS